MGSINDKIKPVYLVYFDTCVYRKTLYAELINLAQIAKIPCEDEFLEVETCQKRWNIEGKTYQDYLDFLIKIYQKIYANILKN